MRFAVVAGVALALFALDIALYVYRGPDATLSQQFRDWVEQYPIVAFILGVLAGHVLWPLRP